MRQQSIAESIRSEVSNRFSSFDSETNELFESFESGPYETVEDIIGPDTMEILLDINKS